MKKLKLFFCYSFRFFLFIVFLFFTPLLILILLILSPFIVESLTKNPASTIESWKTQVKILFLFFFPFLKKEEKNKVGEGILYPPMNDEEMKRFIKDPESFRKPFEGLHFSVSAVISSKEREQLFEKNID